ncbi:MAG: vitamin B12-dependent ribonucleotide reductase [Planctomycetales bacterium]|nr:vitamin B12-dependent ribonucleotide reductase [Planctomycetales bacterium]NIM08360.1 vitamin B12-dependent ribonucleotide reductase [Planctomycetales bacterium]NIN07836.1 vitamin B12-dependent ribonucleotide reductase [Planctomycetales bacterium]NIN76964.1 vitamin B12-dependent ribonucleotide reductase [Planctomycetales bacterium]NIO34148.1 vitamin B12-dependent ribonucleotide reductase [Planctomycetales bacterium]
MATAEMDVSTRSLFDRGDREVEGRGGGLRFDPLFCGAGVQDPFETVEWERRSAEIRGESGEVLFEQHDVEIPAGWSQLATNVVVSKYFYGEVGTPEREGSVRQLIHRVSRTIADWGLQDGYFASSADGENFYRELTWLCLHQHGAFNSPVWFNVGLHHQYGVQGAQCNWHWDATAREAQQPENPYEYPQGSACFIQSVDDNMEAIMGLATSEAMLFKFGSGTGTDLSTLRSHREKLSGGGRPSGPMSFMRVYDQIAAVVKSGGKTRRAAKMQSLKVWHPDIMEFIDCKAKEEAKAHVLIEKGGYDANFNGEAYSSIMFQNANLSVRVTDDFMNAVVEDRDWTTHWVTDLNQPGPTYPAREIMQRMASNAWKCGDPGVQYDTTINRWHTCPQDGRINASNPCSEYMFLDDTACNLASINLMKFRREDGLFDTERFEHACRVFFVAQEILVDHASYPTKAIAENSHRFRPLGLGYSNLGSLLMTEGHPYDSDEAYGICGAITALLHGAANLASVEMAAALGPFEGFEVNRDAMLDVMRMHRDAVDQIHGACPVDLKDAARQLWNQVLENGQRFGFRNAQATVLAPTGTISFLMDCDTTGIEPDIALVKYKQLAGGGMLKIVNRSVPIALKRLGYDQPHIESILAYIDQHDKIEGAPDLKEEHLPVFDCAFEPAGGGRSIDWRSHVKMMAAAQPFLSGAISKTVNMPSTTTVEDIAEAYTWGWRLGLKALAIYRDGSKQSQPLATSTEADRAEQKQKAAPRRERLPDTRSSITHKFSIDGHEGYLSVGLYEDGRPGEVFITMAKEGSTIGGLMDCFGTAISICLQYGVPLEVLVNKFSHTRFDPMGFTKNPDIRNAKSIVDYIFRWLGCQFIPGYREANLGLPVEEGVAEKGRGGDGGGPGKVPEGDEEDSETETRPVAMEAGGLIRGQGSARTGQATNGKSRNGHHGNGQGATGRAMEARLEQAGISKVSHTLRSDQFSKFQADAPLCGACGAITVRSGNCYLCYNCGNSMGCS